MKELENIPDEGFIKTSYEKPKLGLKQKAELIRKGNQAFNEGNIDLARKVFITTDYHDGLSRLGSYYYKNGKIVDAMQMFVLSKDEYKKSWFFKQTADLLRHWMEE